MSSSSIASGATSYSCTANAWSLNSIALSQISEVTYYLGGRAYNSTTHYGTTEEVYAWERGTTVYSGRPTNWTGLVGLMYPSDYAYTFANGVDDTCYSDNYNCKSSKGGNSSSSWLYKSDTSQWTFSHDSNSAYYVFTVHSESYVNGYSEGYVNGYSAYIGYGVRPVVYLKSDIKLDGTGTSSDPYVIIE